jgi:membrane associated rhomboid family serine protease
MLEDRDYMRAPEYGASRVSWTVVILIVNAAVFLAQLVAGHFAGGADFEYRYLALSLDGIRHGYYWQLLTFQFMHAGWMHLIFNSLAIYFFGRSVELVLGRNRFLTLYFTAGILGGVAQMLFNWATASEGPVVGASAGGAGLIAAFAVINWLEEFTLLIYFFPVTMRGRTLLWASLGISLLLMLTPGTGIANAAHLGGILTGWLYARTILHGHWPQWNFFPRRRQRQSPVMAATPARGKSLWRSTPPEEEVSADQYLQNEVDPILDKISAHGLQSLTAREREILETARKKMGRS